MSSQDYLDKAAFFRLLAKETGMQNLREPCLKLADAYDILARQAAELEAKAQND
jgi:hypothetical protein